MEQTQIRKLLILNWSGSLTKRVLGIFQWKEGYILFNDTLNTFLFTVI